MFRKLTTRERRTEPGDRGRRRVASKEFRTSYDLLLSFFISLSFLFLPSFIILICLSLDNCSRNRSCQESSFGRAVARARRGTLSQHSGSPASLIALRCQTYVPFNSVQERKSSWQRCLFSLTINLAILRVVDQARWRKQLHVRRT